MLGAGKVDTMAVAKLVQERLAAKAEANSESMTRAMG
jgi:hypothetical protein